MNKELLVSLGTKQRGLNKSLDHKAETHGRTLKLVNHALVLIGRAHDPAFPNLSLPDFKLRLNQRYDVAARDQEGLYFRQNQFQRDKRNIDGRQMDQAR